MTNAETAATLESAFEKISITFYDREVPSFVEAALERLYGNIYCSFAAWRLSGALEDASTFVLSWNGSPITIFVFRRASSKVTVLNEVIAINHADVRRFAECVFANYPDVNVISFRAIETDVRSLPFPFQRANFLEDIVVSVPESETEYLARLGPAARKNLKRHRNRLVRDFPSFSHRTYEGAEIDEQSVRAIVRFNWIRMAAKNKVSGFDEKAIQGLLALAKERGFVWIGMIQGRICGGAICDSVGSDFFMKISAHDSAYDSYRLGTLCCYLAICECIRRGGRKVHLLWGRYDYKFHLSGIQRDLDCLVVYRDRIQLIKHGRLAAQTAVQGALRQLKLSLLDRQDRLIGRVARAAAGWLRGLRRVRGIVQ